MQWAHRATARLPWSNTSPTQIAAHILTSGLHCKQPTWMVCLQFSFPHIVFKIPDPWASVELSRCSQATHRLRSRTAKMQTNSNGCCGADYLADNTLTLTIFAPTNDAWVKRLPTLTRANGITVADLFSESKSAALQNMLQYHILNKAQGVSIPSCIATP